MVKQNKEAGTDQRKLSRRLVLAGMGSVGIGMTTAGCIGDDEQDDTGDDAGDDTGGDVQDDTGDDAGDDGDTGAPVNLDFGTFNEGTAWFVMGSAIGENLEGRLPTGSTVNVLPFAGTYGNIDLLRDGEVDIAFGTEVVNKWSREGRFDFEDEEPFEGLQTIAGHLDVNWVPTAISESAAEEYGIETYSDLQEQEAEISLGIGPGGSISHIAAEHLYNAHGFSIEEAEDWGMEINEFSLPDMPSAISSGDIQGLTYVSSPGHPTWTEIASETDMRFLPVENFDYLAERDWSEVSPLPEGMFDASQETPMMGFRSLIMTTEDLSNEVAYTIAETLVEDRESLVDAYASMEAFDAETGTLEQWLGAPLHDGAREYFEEANILQNLSVDHSV